MLDKGMRPIYNGWMEHPYFLSLAYVGTAFYGWQVQSSLRSVQGELWAAVRQLWGGAPMPQGAGRTDAGVHAKEQGVLIRMQNEWQTHRLLAALNAHLPADVRVRAVQAAHEGFFPRHHAVAKRYVYRIDTGPAADPFLESRRWHIYGAAGLEGGAVSDAASRLVGRHDFSGFRSVECSAPTPVATLFDARLLPRGSGFDVVFEGDRFLMHQVRIMVGTLVDVGRGRLGPDDVSRILDSKNRRLAGPTAPPQGLYLEKIWYAPEWGIGEPSPWRTQGAGL